MKKRLHIPDPVPLLTGKYGLLLLTLLNAALACLVAVLSNRWQYLGCTFANKDFMTFYLIDYRVGFVSRALIGSVVYLFTKHPTVGMISAALTVTALLSLLLFAFLQAQIVRKTLQRKDHAALLASYLFFLNAIFWCNTFEWIGMLDVFMTLLAQFYLFFAERKRSLAFALAPVVCFLGLMVHTAFFCVYFPVVAAILWFELLRRGKPRAARVSLFVVTCAVSVALFILFTFFAQKFVRIGWDELLALMREKYDGKIFENYFSYYLYGVDEVKDYTAHSTKELLPFLFRSLDLTSSKLRLNFLNFLPLTALFLGGCVYHARTSGNRAIAYLGFFAPLVMLFPSLNFSDDKNRFFSLILLAQYMLLHYITTQTDGFFLPCTAAAPAKKLSHYESGRRAQRLRRVLQLGTAAALAFTLAGYRFL